MSVIMRSAAYVQADDAQRRTVVKSTGLRLDSASWPRGINFRTRAWRMYVGFFVGFLWVFFFTPSVQFWTGKWCKVNELLTIKCINIQKLLFSLCLQSQHCFNKKTNKQKPHISASLHQTGQAKRSKVYNVYSFDAAYPETALLQEMWCCASCHCTYAH